MRAMIFSDYGKMTLDDVPPPQAGANEALLEVAACGICGSDLEGYMATPGMRDRRVPPLLLGHEFAGTVVSGPAEWQGRVVAVNPLVSCGVCAQCLAGKRHLCPQRSLIGLNRPGAFCERVVVPVSQLYPLPEGYPLWRGALAEPLAVAIHAVDLAGPLLGRRVLVFGGGTIGFLAAWVAAEAGADVEIVEVQEGRREQIASLGLKSVAAPAGEVDVTIDSVGIEVTRQGALKHLAPGGSAIFLGLHDDGHAFNFYPLVLQERRVQGSYTYTDADFKRAVALSARLPEGFAHKKPLSEGPESFAALAHGKTSVLKILLEPHA